jgi:hypothetical protein
MKCAVRNPFFQAQSHAGKIGFGRHRPAIAESAQNDCLLGGYDAENGF